MAENLFPQTIPSNMFRDSVKFDRQEKFDIIFTCFLAAIAKFQFLEGILSTWLCINLNLSFS